MATKISTLVFTLSLAWWKQKGTVKVNIDKKRKFFSLFSQKLNRPEISHLFIMTIPEL